jgi:hypothetical protein
MLAMYVGYLPFYVRVLLFTVLSILAFWASAIQLGSTGNRAEKLITLLPIWGGVLAAYTCLIWA